MCITIIKAFGNAHYHVDASHITIGITNSITYMGEKTTLSKASQFASLRTVVPISIVRQLKLKEGDTLDWDMTVIEGKMALIVKKE